MGRSGHEGRDDVCGRERAVEQPPDALSLWLRRLQPAPLEQCRVLPPVARRAQLAASLSARIPATDRTNRRRRLGSGRRPRCPQPVELRCERGVRTEHVCIRGRQLAERVAWTVGGTRQDALRCRHAGARALRRQRRREPRVSDWRPRGSAERRDGRRIPSRELRDSRGRTGLVRRRRRAEPVRRTGGHRRAGLSGLPTVE